MLYVRSLRLPSPVVFSISKGQMPLPGGSNSLHSVVDHNICIVRNVGPNSIG